MNADAYPEGIMIRLVDADPEKRGGLTLERVDADHWAEVGYHCVDCAEEYTTEQAQALLDAHESVEVLHVPAAWLAERLETLLDAIPEPPEEVHEAIRDLAVDAGLS